MGSITANEQNQSKEGLGLGFSSPSEDFSHAILYLSPIRTQSSLGLQMLSAREATQYLEDEQYPADLNF